MTNVVDAGLYQKCLAKLNQKIALGFNRSLNRISEALHQLGNPQLKYPTVHVAGTNGKGSTCALMHSILTEAGYKTGLTLSPHMNSVRERLQISGELISRDLFCDLYEEVSNRLENISLTYFEFLVAMAFVYFEKQKVDVAVIETGMGGRFDATNLVVPVVGAITTVSLDHQEFLGDSESKILGEKMQIAKPGMDFWSGIQNTDLINQLKKHCVDVGASFFSLDDYFSYGKENKFIFDNSIYETSLLGEHQKRNTALSVGMSHGLRKKGYAISDENIREGILKTRWPARLEWFDSSPPVLIDGAHNAEGIAALSAYLKQKNIRATLVYGCLNNRPLTELIQPLLPYLKGTLYLINFLHEKSYKTSQLLKFVSEFKNKGILKVEVLNLNEGSWQTLMSDLPDGEPVVVTGSLYMAAQVRQYLAGGEE